MTEYQKWLTENRVRLEQEYLPGLGGGYESCEINGREVRLLRNEAMARFSFAIPSEEAVKAIGAHAPILEVGAGLGYWAYEVDKAGFDIIATDPEPYSDNFIEPGEEWFPVKRLGGVQAVNEFGAGRTLLMVWPSYRLDWPADTLEAYLDAGGRALIYVGEGEGGCTGNRRFHEILNERTPEEPEVTSIPFWAGIHDQMYVYRLR